MRARAGTVVLHTCFLIVLGEAEAPPVFPAAQVGRSSSSSSCVPSSNLYALSILAPLLFFVPEEAD